MVTTHDNDNIVVLRHLPKDRPPYLFTEAERGHLHHVISTLYGIRAITGHHWGVTDEGDEWLVLLRHSFQAAYTVEKITATQIRFAFGIQEGNSNETDIIDTVYAVFTERWQDMIGNFGLALSKYKRNVDGSRCK